MAVWKQSVNLGKNLYNSNKNTWSQVKQFTARTDMLMNFWIKVACQAAKLLALLQPQILPACIYLKSIERHFI